MSPENTEKLLTAFPRLYADYYLSPRSSCMCQGFDVDDGWMCILWDLSKGIERVIAGLPSTYPDDLKPKAAQVKEKFASLRFYMTYSNSAIDDLIRDAERRSKVTCEHCGKLGSLRKGGWLRTLCDPCDEERLSSPWTCC